LRCKLTYFSVFWSNDTLGLIQYPDFWETVAQNIQVYRNNILELDDHVIRLQDGTEIPTDALLCGTGWTANSPRFFSWTERARLELPHCVGQATKDHPLWTHLEDEADRRVLADFPRLAKPPDYYKKPTTTIPYRLYNCMAPLHDDSIIFLGHIHVPNAFRAAECQTIWATAYLDQKVKLPAMEDMQKEVALMIAWNRRRYLNNGRDDNYLHYDLVGYTDKLLSELGLSCRRKGWLADLFAPRKASEFESPRKEHLEKMRVIREQEVT
jgi:dimethylaniline monooxygenase (N-oxide forming)